MPEYISRDSLHPLHPFTQIVTLPSFNITAEGYGKDNPFWRILIKILFLGSKKNEAKRQAAKAMIKILKENGFPYGAGMSSLGTSVS